MDELIVFFMREFGWTLEYTRNLVKTLPIKKLNALIAETKYQKAVDDYNLKITLFNIVTNPHTKHPKGGGELLGQPPSRNGKGKTGDLYKAAEKVGIKTPKGRQE